MTKWWAPNPSVNSVKSGDYDHARNHDALASTDGNRSPIFNPAVALSELPPVVGADSRRRLVEQRGQDGLCRSNNATNKCTQVAAQVVKPSYGGNRNEEYDEITTPDLHGGTI
ncbi:hypothetical protein MRX96_005760 [Rhipicephalus microplus]